MPDEVKSKLIDLIDYVGQVIKLSEKTCFLISKTTASRYFTKWI